MRQSVLHKGIVIVAVPLAMQLVYIALLGDLLSKCDRAQAREAERSYYSMIGARLLFANCTAGSILLKAWNSQDMSLLDQFPEQCDYIDRLDKQMGCPADDVIEGREIHAQAMQAQEAVTRRLRQIEEVAHEGIGPGTYRQVVRLHHRLVKELDHLFGLMQKRYSYLDAAALQHRAEIERMQQTELSMLLAGFAASAGAAFLLFRYYNSQILRRIEKTKEGVASITFGKKLHGDIGGSDEIAALYASFKNMSIQLAASAERERALFENSSDMIIILDEELKVIRANKAAQQFTGIDPDAIKGRDLRTILTESSREACEERLLNARSFTDTLPGSHFEANSDKRALPGLQFEADILQTTGNSLATLWSVFWSPDKKTCHCVLHNVSEERELDKMRAAFLKLIAADFSKPLNHMSNIVEKLVAGAYGNLPESATKKITGATGTLSRMISMVDELIQLEALKTVAVNLKQESHRVADVISAAIKDTESAAQRKGISVDLECNDALHFDVDADRITRVIMNFLSNAIKFSPENSAVKICAEKTREDEVKISVIDSARGIPEKAMSTLFQSFKQVDSADGKRGKGTGLGLVVCKRIVEAHGGRVGVESEEGKGSCFWFKIPLVLASVPATQAATNEERIQKQKQEAAMTVALPGGRKWHRLSMKQKGWVLIGIPMLFQLLFVSVMSYSFYESNQSYAEQVHNRAVNRNAIRVALPYFKLLVLLRQHTPPDITAKDCNDVTQEVADNLKIFYETVKNDNLASGYYQLIVRFMRTTLLPLTKQIARTIQTGMINQEMVSDQLGDRVVLYNTQLSQGIFKLCDACEQRDKDTPARLKKFRELETNALYAAIAASIAAAGWLAIYFSSDVVRRLLVLSDNSQRLTSGMQLNPPISGTDEIAQLDRSFHETAQRLEEARATESSFLDNANNIICSINPDGSFATLNRAAAEKLNIPTDEISDRTLQSLVADEQAAQLQDALSRAKTSGTPQTIELKLEAANTAALAGESAIDTMWSILFSESEQLFYAVAYDISSRRELERMKTEFLSLVTHDLRTPLTTIQATAILLESNAFGEMPEPARECTSKIKAETKCILELVNDLLDLSKLEAGELKIESAMVSVAELVQKVREIMSQENVYLASYAIPEEMEINADIDRLSAAISGLALELFSGQKDAFLKLEDTEDKKLSIAICGLRTADCELRTTQLFWMPSTQAKHHNTA